MKAVKALLAVAMMVSGAAHADFQKVDWLTSGDEKGFVDLDTGIEWLQTAETLGMSIQQVSDLLDTTYKGWRLPTHAEVLALQTNMTNEPGGLVANWNTYFVPTDGNYRMGLYVHDNGNVLSSGTRGNAAAWNYTRSSSLTYAGSFAGVFLVSDGGTTLSSKLDPSLNINNPNAPEVNAVSTPLTGLIGLSLLGLAAVKRRKQ